MTADQPQRRKRTTEEIAELTKEIGYGARPREMSVRAQEVYDRLGNLTPQRRRRLEVAHVRCGRSGCTKSLIQIYRTGRDFLAVPQLKMSRKDRNDHSEDADIWKARDPFILGEDWYEGAVALRCRCGWPAKETGFPAYVDVRKLILVLNSTTERELMPGHAYAVKIADHIEHVFL